MNTTIATITPTSKAITDLDANLLAGQCAPSTIAMYQRDAAAYLAWCKSEGVAPVDSTSLAQWRTHLATDTAMSPNTINRMLSAVKRIVREGASQGFTTQENAEEFRHVVGVRKVAMKERTRPHNRVRITPADMRKMCDAPDTSTPVGLRDAALLATLASTGARIASIAGLTIGQISKQGRGYVVSIMGKNESEYRPVPLTVEAYKAIMAWIDRRPAMSQHVFTSFSGRGNRATTEPMSEVSAWRTVQKYAAAVGLAHIKPHDFRRFVGTQLATRKGVHVAQQVLGHKDPRTTLQNYVLSDLAEDVTEGLY